MAQTPQKAAEATQAEPESEKTHPKISQTFKVPS
jgi:hypothetical protein